MSSFVYHIQLRDICHYSSVEWISPCGQMAAQWCDWYMHLPHFKLVSLFNLSVSVLLCLMLVMQAVAMYRVVAMSHLMKKYISGRLAWASRWRLGSALIILRFRRAVYDYCEQHIFHCIFATEEQQRWMAELHNHRQTLRDVRLSCSLRVSLACAFTLFVTSGLTIAICVVIVSYLRMDGLSLIHNALQCVLAGSIIGCIFVWLAVWVHYMALHVAVKRRLIDYIEAKHTSQSIESVLRSSRVRWFSLPFYFGSFFGCMLWSYSLSMRSLPSHCSLWSTTAFDHTSGANW